MKQHSHLNWIELSRSALKKNVDSLAKLAGNAQLALSVKSNAYGHGLTEIVGMLSTMERPEYVTVHSVDEAELVRAGGWTKKLMMIGPLAEHQYEAVIELDIEPVIVDEITLDQLGRLGDRLGRTMSVHLKLETGTNRQGLTDEELPAIASIFKKYDSLQYPEGASTHFANIEDTTNHEYAEYQLKEFTRLCGILAELEIKPRLLHTASSAATILFDNTHFDLVRPGIAMYGHWPSKETYLSYRLEGGENNLFEPVLSWRCRITQVKNLAPDCFVGYGCTYRTTAQSRLAVLPIGYYDGYDRSLSNIAYVLIDGKRAPVRGRICMNLMMVEVTDIPEAQLHDPVTLIGRDQSEVIGVEQLATWAGTINYEILARLGASARRLVTH